MFSIFLRFNVPLRQFSMTRSWTALAMLDLTVSSNSVQTNVHSSSMASLSSFSSLLTSVSTETEEDDVAFCGISACCPCMLFATMLKFSVKDLFFGLFPAPIFAHLARSSLSRSACLIASTACTCDAISRASASETSNCVCWIPGGLSTCVASFGLASCILTSFTSPSILATTSAAYVERESRSATQVAPPCPTRVLSLVPPSSRLYPLRCSPVPSPSLSPSCSAALS